MFVSSKRAFSWLAYSHQWWVTNSPKSLRYLYGAKFSPIYCLHHGFSGAVYSLGCIVFLFLLPTVYLWSGCGLHCPCLRNLLIVCFLSQQAPSSLLEALEQHLASLEGKKVKDSTAASRYVNPPLTVLTFSLLNSPRPYFFLEWILERISIWFCSLKKCLIHQYKTH